MKFRNKEYNNRYVMWIAINVLAVIDMILISVEILFFLPPNVENFIQIFDLIVCIILLFEFFLNLYLSKPKSVFLKQKSNWADLIASIPYDLILPTIFSSLRFFRLLRILKVIRVFALFNKSFEGFNRFLKISNLDKILGVAILVVLLFTGLLYFYGPSYGLFDDFYFVMVTLTTVGYGDVYPQTYNERALALVLIVIGVLTFSAITAGISSYLTERLISKDEKKIDEDINEVKNQLEIVNNDLKYIKKENEMLHEEIRELKDIILKR